MLIESDPSKVTLSKDVANYRHDFVTDSHAKKEFKKLLKKLNGAKYPESAPDGLFKRFDTYQDFAFTGASIEGRLGGKLENPSPEFDLPIRPPGATSDLIFAFPTDHDSSNTGTVTIKPDGTIVHSSISGDDLEATDHYMHLVFDYVLHKTRDLLEAINTALNWYNEDITDPDASVAYTKAVNDFNEFVDGPTGPSTSDPNPYRSAFQKLEISPVLTREGYIVSARIEMRFKNPAHSSSTVRVP
ncbi:MAG: hypothetical protein L0Y58_13690 [Verrucomicrobia subdivision 3 bacterium]|nr:hypothetical protein [Limisphaerales bacterium]